MPHKPFFSVVIPTTGRADSLKDAMQSVLLQEFADYELIVSDNSGDRSMGKIVGLLHEKSKEKTVRYVAPDHQLNMPDHWEFASQKVRGEYVLFLTDRSVFIAGALQEIYDAIQKSQKSVHVCSWLGAIFDEGNKIFKESPKLEGAQKRIPSRNMAAKFLENPSDLYAIPRSMNSCYRRDLGERIRKEHGRLFMPLFPDCTSAFLFLAYSDEVLFVDRTLYIGQGGKGGTGRNFSYVDPYPYMDSLGMAKDETYRHVPIKAPFTRNIIFEDFLKIQGIAQGYNLDGVAVDWEVYFLANYRELIKKGSGSMDRSLAEHFSEEWEKGLDTLGYEMQEKIRTQAKNIQSAKQTVRTMARIKKSLPFHAELKKIKNIFTSGPVQEKTYGGILEAAGFKYFELRN